jgi:predicted phage tail protein
MVIVYFPPYLQKLTDGVKEQKFDTDDFQILIAGLRTLFPKLSNYISQIDSRQIHNLMYFVDKNSEELIHIKLSRKIQSSELVLIITLYGEAFAALGAALMASGFAIGSSTALITIGSTVLLSGASLISTGLSLILSSVMSLLASPGGSTAAPQSSNDTPVRANNDAFDGLKNTTSTDTTIPLVYGCHRVPGQFIDGKIKTINHDRGTNILVKDYIS